ncbi:Glucose--fructose oxidoreductase precursor [Anatilimnocola aggregata]|uniref:Glucose--fructose oxidoreductase n=1 Tax=Anatilimnocola aggregata TaxID=2528021 RepID=A0A517Y471_9BACT|nr:Gfo/Idh/MocA family oxidoreductase [Anatilimnocola aggregata]QDU25049.1 Glucose--fructose oxidoreductase precursor [Anatilimnocola aggregata]
MNLSRRKFLISASVTTLCSVTATAEPARSANNIVRVGVIGTGVRGKYLIGNLPTSAQVTAICDCSQSRMASTLEPQGAFSSVLQSFRDNAAAKCTTHQDYRRMFDREKLDAVIVATPDHHHTLAAMLALQAGLDVYLEKPLTVCVREGRLLVDAVKKSGRVLQVGSQQRTMEVNRFACEFIRNGGLGKITKVELPCYPGPISDCSFPAETTPAGLNWDMFCGPTPVRPHNRQVWMKEDFKVGDLLWRGWDLFRDYSGHLMTNWGAHSVDMVQLALGRDDSGPVEVRTVKPESVQALAKLWKDKTPYKPTGVSESSSQRSGAERQLTDERRYWPVVMSYADGVELHFIHGPDFIRFYGERGTLKMRRNYFETDPPALIKNGPHADVDAKWRGAGHVARPHLENWLAAIRTETSLNAPVEVGHRTATICHLANLARELNRPLRWNPETEQFVADAEANHLLDRPRRKGFELPM